jgi:HlyD family secretion protein
MGDREKKNEKKRKSIGAVGTPSGASQTGQAGDAIGEFSFPDTSRRKGRRKGWIIAVAMIAVIVVVLLAGRALRLQKTATANSAYSTYTVQRGDITETLSGSGTLEPADSYTVTSLISGDIISAAFEEGDVVVKDQALYTVDSSDVGTSIQQAENNLTDSQYKYDSALEQLEDLRLKTGGAGNVTAVNVEAGDTVQAGQTVAVIRNSDILRLKVLFQKDAVQGFTVGESAEITLDGSFDVFTGTVSEISAVDQVLPGNILVRQVTVEFSNPGALSSSDTAYAVIGEVSAVQSGTLEYKFQENVVATASATVAKVSVDVGDYVSKGQVILSLQSDSVDQQVHSALSAVENAQLSLDSQKEKLTDYTVTSPISGTIVQKDYKAGDTLKSGAVLCTIYDLSHLTLTLNVDELDIKKIQPGQPVTVTAAAAEGQEYAGRVTKVNIKGTTKNGVTSYPVTIEIDKTDGLLPGMNVDAKITVNSLKNVLLVPVGTVQRGSFVLLKTDVTDPLAVEAGIPAGFSYTEVTLGPSNDTDIVITAGLTEGDIVAVLDTTPTSYDYNLFQRPNQTVSSTGGSADSGSTGITGGTNQAPPDMAGAAG